MCQQTLTVIGLLLDSIGFVLVAVEWRRAFMHQTGLREDELERAYALKLRDEYGNKDVEVPPSLEDLTTTMAGDFSKLHYKEKSFRLRLFYFGVFLVLLGFALQVLGTWAGGVWWFRPC